MAKLIYPFFILFKTLQRPWAVPGRVNVLLLVGVVYKGSMKNKTCDRESLSGAVYPLEESTEIDFIFLTAATVCEPSACVC